MNAAYVRKASSKGHDQPAAAVAAECDQQTKQEEQTNAEEGETTAIVLSRSWAADNKPQAVGQRQLEWAATELSAAESSPSGWPPAQLPVQGAAALHHPDYQRAVSTSAAIAFSEPTDNQVRQLGFMPIRLAHVLILLHTKATSRSVAPVLHKCHRNLNACSNCTYK